MKASLKTRSIAMSAVVWALALNPSVWAEKIDCSGTKTSKDAPYREVIRPGDQPDHELILAIRNHLISSKHPDFDGSTQTAFALQDEYARAGTQTGYFLYSLQNGDKVWARFDSVDLSRGPRDSWEVSYQGVFRFIDGAGKFAGIRGGGSYQGTVRPPLRFEERFQCEAEF